MPKHTNPLQVLHNNDDVLTQTGSSLKHYLEQLRNVTNNQKNSSTFFPREKQSGDATKYLEELLKTVEKSKSPNQTTTTTNEVPTSETWQSNSF